MFSVLLFSKINLLDIFDMNDFFQISTEIFIESNFWLGMYGSGTKFRMLKCKMTDIPEFQIYEY